MFLYRSTYPMVVCTKTKSIFCIVGIKRTSAILWFKTAVHHRYNVGQVHTSLHRNLYVYHTKHLPLHNNYKLNCFDILQLDLLVAQRSLFRSSRDGEANDTIVFMTDINTILNSMVTEQYHYGRGSTYTMLPATMNTTQTTTTWNTCRYKMFQKNFSTKYFVGDSFTKESITW